MAELRELLGQCVEDLKAGGLLAVVENQFVIADATGAGANKEVIPNEEARSERCDRGLGRESTDQDRDREAPSVPQQMHQAETVDAGDAEEAPAEDWDAAPDSAQDMDVLERADELEFVPEEPDETALAQDDVAAEPSFYLAQARAEPTDEPERAQEPATEGLNVGSPEGTENVDVFDLTDALELAPEQEDETAIEPDVREEDAKPSSTATNGSEEPTEPRRKDIIGALRQFISSDEPENK